MNRTPDVELVLRDYLADDGLTAPDFVLDAVETRIGVERQRRAWPFPGRTTTVTTQIKLIAALAAALVVAVVGYNLLPGISGPGTPTAAPTLAPTPTPTHAPPSPTLGSGVMPDGRLAAGHYTIPLPTDVFPGMTLAADIPADWTGYPEIPALTGPSDGASRGSLLGFMPALSLFRDPCHWDVDGTGSIDQPGDVVVGTTVDDVVAALQANTAYTSSAASPISIGGFQGKVLELQLPGNDVLLTCDGDPAQQSDNKFIVMERGFWAQGPDSKWRLFILDVNGTRLITMIATFGSIPQAELDAWQAIVESFVITA